MDIALPQARPRATWPAAVVRAVDFIEAHLYEPIDAGTLADAACMSRFHFARVFRTATGVSPMEYLRHRRIAQAELLLREGRRKVIQIASDLCFFDQSHFVRSFRQVNGCTPSGYVARACEPR
ncbi:AraC family transcriptional regulator [Xanthomonas sp. XNM01]|uniref:helix-turn-helix domain-containing protein n=1 Tax=Xanthomonas sp. XNM01 TaxID=2769289 RepID=UPI00177FC521|nr:AraC family transcriptional regulator [Xanthomonas sp. XNM01]MBD9370071.1 helix-turn-helix transcriptional regulator [Xanthomonas sp. XNM01]